MKTLEKLFILPFDHRSYFLKKIGVTDREPTESEKALVADLKHIIYQGFQKSFTQGVLPEQSGILVDDLYGSDILRDAKSRNIITIQTTEVSGKDFFEFEHGADAEKFLTEVQPDYAKALVRFDPRKNGEYEQISLRNLKLLQEICTKTGIGFLIEPLIIPTEHDIAQYGDKHGFDEEMRPSLICQMINLFHQNGIDPDIWKIEGFIHPENYQKVSEQLSAIKPSAQIIILGRGETAEYVEQWINAGKKVPSVIGFAVGRTVFDEALDQYRGGTMSRDQAADAIAHNFVHFYTVFNA